VRVASGTQTRTHSHCHSLTLSLTHTVTHIVTHSLIPLHCQLSHSVTRLLGHPPTWSLTHSLTHSTGTCSSLWWEAFTSLWLMQATPTTPSPTHCKGALTRTHVVREASMEYVYPHLQVTTSLARALTQSLTQSLNHSHRHSTTHSLTQSLTHSLPHRLLQWHHHLQPVPRQLRHQVLHQQPLLHSLRQWHLQADLCMLRHCVLRLLVSDCVSDCVIYCVSEWFSSASSCKHLHFL
jgi:hypothetical protein